MPFPINWVEELLCEWLQLRGYVVLTNVRLRGAEEADIIGLRKEVEPAEPGLLKEKLVVMHVEAGSLTNNLRKNLMSVKAKFSLDRIEAIKKISVDIIELESVLGKFWLGHSRLGASDIVYKPLYVASKVRKKQLSNLKELLGKDGIDFLTLKEVLKEVLKDIKKWKDEQVKRGLKKTERITLQGCFWLLNLIDFMMSEQLISADS